MKVWQDPDEWLKEAPALAAAGTALTIGNFDGVHLGHRELLRRTVEHARRRGLYSMLLTFHPHPIQILAPEKKHTRLFALEDQRDRLGESGLQGMVRQPFSRAFSEISAPDFLESYLLKYFQPAVLAVGHDFSFGAHRAGNADLLRTFCDRHRIQLERVAAQTVDGEIVSTSRIREHLLKGELEIAEKMLGRRYYLKGIVETGEGRGRRLGFPTANIRPDVDFYPKMGVYAGIVELKNQSRLKAVMNLGFNPTFVEGDHNPVKAEVHILDFSGDIYGQTLKIEFCGYLRPEKKFSGLDDLKSQIQADIQRAREILA